MALQFSDMMTERSPSLSTPSSKGGAYQKSLFADVASTTIEGYKGIKGDQVLAETESEITKNIEEYKNQSPTYQALLNKEVDNLQAEITNLEANPNSLSSENNAKLENLKRTFKEKSNQLSKASKQGIITPLELESRLDATIKQLVTQNPAFRNEIIALGASEKDIQGIGSIVKQDIDYYNNIAKEQAAFLEKVITYSKEFGVNENDFRDPETGEIDRVAQWNEVQIRIGKKGTYEQSKLLIDNQDIDWKKEKYSILKEKKHIDYLEGQTLTLQSELSKIYDDPNLDINGKEKAALIQITRQQNEMNAWIGKFGNDKDLSYIKDIFDNTITNLKTSLKDIADGTTMRKYVENSYQIIKTNSSIELAKHVDPAQSDFIFQMIDKFGSNMSDAQKTDLMQSSLYLADAFIQAQTTQTLSINKGILENTFTNVISTSQGKQTTQAEATLNSTFDKALKIDPNNKVAGIYYNNANQVVNMYSKYIEENPDKSLKHEDTLIIKLGSEEGKQLSPIFDTTTKGTIINILDKNSKNINKQVTALKNTPDGVIISQSADGTLIARKDPNIVAKNKTAQEKYINKFNTAIIQRINNGMKAYANLMGRSTSEVSAEYLTKFYGPTFKQLTGQSINTEVEYTDKQKQANDILGI